MIKQYNVYLEKRNVNIIRFKYDEDDDLVRLAEDVQFGIIELTKLIREHNKK